MEERKKEPGGLRFAIIEDISQKYGSEPLRRTSDGRSRESAPRLPGSPGRAAADGGNTPSEKCGFFAAASEAPPRPDGVLTLPGQ